MSKSIVTIAMFLLCGHAAHAHEIGTTRVAVTFQEGRAYDIELVTDAQSLLEKLSASRLCSPARMNNFAAG